MREGLAGGREEQCSISTVLGTLCNSASNSGSQSSSSLTHMYSLSPPSTQPSAVSLSSRCPKASGVLLCPLHSLFDAPALLPTMETSKFTLLQMEEYFCAWEGSEQGSA